MIVVVTGLPRSGTSMMMQMLAAGGMPVLTDHSRPADHGNPRGYLEYEPVKALARDSSWVAEAGGKAVKVVVPLLTRLPQGHNYRMIMITRDLDEVLASQTELLRALGRPVGDPAVIRPVFVRQLREAALWLSRHAIPVLELEYSSILAGPDKTARSITRFLDRDLDERSMAAAVVPELRHQRSHRCDPGAEDSS